MRKKFNIDLDNDIHMLFYCVHFAMQSLLPLKFITAVVLHLLMASFLMWAFYVFCFFAQLSEPTYKSIIKTRLRLLIQYPLNKLTILQRHKVL